MRHPLAKPLKPVQHDIDPWTAASGLGTWMLKPFPSEVTF